MSSAVWAEVKTLAENLPWQTPNYTFTARDMPVRDVIFSFAMAQKMSIIVSPAVDSRISGDFRNTKPADFLEQVCSMNNLMWYYDGASLYIYRAGDILSVLVDLKFMKASEVRQMLTELGVEDERFPLMTTSGDELVMVSGPPRYVELVQEMIAKADRLRQLRAVQEVDVEVFPIHNAWANDINVGTGQNQIAIPGVATLLSEIMADNGNERMKGDPGTDGKEQDAAQRALEFGKNNFKPVIRADARLNAVVVRDVVTRLPKYREIIKYLDVPVQLVEISITIMDINTDEMLNWEMQLRALGAGKRVSGGAAADIDNLVDVAKMAGLGLTGSLSFISGDFDFLSSLSAMQERGKARTVSRPTILTINNMEAQLQDTKSYHAKVVGKEVAELENVSAGIDFKVRPRIVGSPDNSKRQIWMQLKIDDGGFESVAVDAMPMTRNSSLETQAAVYEGQSLLVGGYMRDIVEDRKWGIPFLRDIPFLGFLFGGIAKNKTNVQRMFLLTPRVVDLNETGLPDKQAVRLRDVSEEDRISDELRKADMERAKREDEQKKRLKQEKEQEKRDSKLSKTPKNAENAEEPAQQEETKAVEKIEAETPVPPSVPVEAVPAPAPQTEAAETSTLLPVAEPPEKTELPKPVIIKTME